MPQIGQNYRTFKELIPSLRAGAIAGMNTKITLEPESAEMLADILEVFETLVKQQAEKNL